MHAFSVTMFARLLFIAVTTLVLIWLLKFREGVAFNSSNKAKLVNLHTLLMIIGFVLVGGEAIMVNKALEAIRRSVRVVHLLLHLIALASGILGVIAVFKAEVHPHHMLTLHSWLGMIAICSLACSTCWRSSLTSSKSRNVNGGFTEAMAQVHRDGDIPGGSVHGRDMGIVVRFEFLSLGRGQDALILNFSGLLLFLFAASVGLFVIHPTHY